MLKLIRIIAFYTYEDDYFEKASITDISLAEILRLQSVAVVLGLK